MWGIEMYDLLGLKLETAIERFHLPTLDPDMFSTKDFSKLRNQLYKASSNNQQLAKQMITILLKGKIEEIKAKDKELILSVQFEYKGELYLADLKLEHFNWSFVGIQYIGETSRMKRIGIKAGLSILSLAILLFAAHYLIQHLNPPSIPGSGSDNQVETISTNQQEESSTEQLSEDAIFLSELKQLARQMDLVLIEENEYQQLLQELSEAEGMLQENKAEENDDTGTENTDESVTIRVTYKMTARQVAQLIVDSNLKHISDVDELTAYFVERNIHYRIRTGVHEIPLDASYEDIARILTTRK